MKLHGKRPLFGVFLREERERQGRTQRDVCGDVLSNGYVGQVEQGKISDVSVTKFLQLCGQYGVSPITVLTEVYGCELEPGVINPKAQQIGETVLGLPDKPRDDMLGWIAFQAKKYQSPQE